MQYLVTRTPLTPSTLEQPGGHFDDTCVIIGRFNDLKTARGWANGDGKQKHGKVGDRFEIAPVKDVFTVQPGELVLVPVEEKPEPKAPDATEGVPPPPAPREAAWAGADDDKMQNNPFA